MRLSKKAIMLYFISFLFLVIGCYLAVASYLAYTSFEAHSSNFSLCSGDTCLLAWHFYAVLLSPLMFFGLAAFFYKSAKSNISIFQFSLGKVAEEITTKKENKSLKIIGHYILLIFIILISVSIIFPLLVTIFGTNINIVLLYGINFVLIGLVFWKLRNITVRSEVIAGLILITGVVIFLCESWRQNYILQQQMGAKIQQTAAKE